MGVCRNCSSSNAKGVRFCRECGAPMVAAPTSKPTDGVELNQLRAVIDRIVADRLAGAADDSKGPAVIDVSDAGGFRLTLVRRDGSDGQTFGLGDQLDIGRSEGALTFDDPHLAPRHARITLTPSGYVLKDLETRNGVYRRLRGPVDLEDGDQILIGEQLLQFSVISEFERNLAYSVAEKVLLFGTPVVPAWGRLQKIMPNGMASDVFHLSRHDIILGRQQGDIVFSDDGFMSPRHAQLSVRQGRPHLEDLNSSNGTFIRLRGSHVLAPGEFIRMGDELLRFDRG